MTTTLIVQDRNRNELMRVDFEKDSKDNFIQAMSRTGSTFVPLENQTQEVFLVLPTFQAPDIITPEPPVQLTLTSVVPGTYTASDNLNIASEVHGTGIDDTCVLFVNGYTSTGNTFVDDTQFNCSLNPLLMSGVAGTPMTVQAVIKKGTEYSNPVDIVLT